MARIELESPVTGVVWKVSAPPGTTVAVGDPVVVVESMKMEIPVEASADGTVAEVLVAEGDQVAEDALVAILQVD
jgi:biotin carboxyl carrier protein